MKVAVPIAVQNDPLRLGAGDNFHSLAQRFAARISDTGVMFGVEFRHA
jgi:hypothetical protein